MVWFAAESWRQMVLIIGEILILALLNLYSWVPMLGRMLFRKVDYLHAEVISDIPGSPHAFDSAIISLVKSLPEPNNFNIVWTSLPLSEPLIVRGRMANARINSLSLYPQRKYEAPTAIDLLGTQKKDGTFEIKICPPNHKDYTANTTTLSSNNWERGLLSMRNYLVPPGTLVYTPEIVRVSDGRVVRKSQKLIAGAPQIALKDSMFRRGVMRCSFTNAMFFIFNSIVLHNVVCWKTTTVIMLISLVLTSGMYQLCYLSGRSSLAKFFSDLCSGEKNKLIEVSLEQGTTTAQPSILHKYWAMTYDIPTTTAAAADGEQEGKHEYELQITGRINKRYQKYWSVVVYDQYGICLPQYVYDGNVRENPVTPSDGRPADEDVFEYDIRLRVHTDNAGSAEDDRGRPKGVTDVDVSSAPHGYVMFRLVHPQVLDEQGAESAELDAHIVAYSQPTVNLVKVNRSTSSSSSSSSGRSGSGKEVTRIKKEA